jgi:hypothetical protein
MIKSLMYYQVSALLDLCKDVNAQAVTIVHQGDAVSQRPFSNAAVA